ncbi:5-methylcytosine-specific restriction protein B [Ruminiclostridium sufflavum DSM 19573]|uniref:5-methylcytosine-specific restriction protein B n=1 Tax=Ruminiclostridium sufflavum DSM 19573 TaxID=1121337 RepID=A0A318XJ82_9FIRM|nr:AAA family ATPase [Ruminiclostridium sufflavum]PYG84909.1 5-methylcytosine-specific restriction protein B [Ruminiclostridium sufflavum DSM 19573]
MENNNSNTAFAWTTFYSEFADKLLLFKNNRTQLLLGIKDSYDSLGMKFPFVDNGELLDDICPFTVFGCFNKGITNDNRIALMKSIGSKLCVKSEVPTEFDGIPVLNNLKAWFFGYKKDRNSDDISNLWNLFEAAIAYADNPSDVTRNAFIVDYDKVRKQISIKWNITMGLYWIRPYSYLNLDERNRSFLTEDSSSYAKEVHNITNFKQVPTAQMYLNIISLCKTFFKREGINFKNFPELSCIAWKSTSIEPTSKKISTASFLKWFNPIVNAIKKLGGSGTPEQVRNQIISDLNLPDKIINETRGKTGTKKFDNEIAFARNYLAYEDFIDKSIRGIWKLTEKGMTAPINEEIASEIFYKWMEINKQKRTDTDESFIVARNEIKYWLYAPGESSRFWDEFYTNNIMGIGWDDMGDLEQYKSKDSMKTKMKELYGEDYSYMNQALATWQFVNEMQIGDIVYVKKGIHKIIGRGVVESDYIYDPSRNEYTHTRKMNWTHNGEWDHPGKAAMKTLTDITYYTDYVQKLETLFASDDTEVELPEKKEVRYPDYTDADFLNEVFIDADRYESLVKLIKVKMNIILQGAPGVGKTFTAKRLAFSIMGKCDTSRVMMVQFHQSYSYEDFIMGYRPTKEGFDLSCGPFYDFCKTAQDDNERDYFFIIDEINRGNLSKIFGELLMLIETDKRGEKLRLLYSNELFSVPKNVHIIGMMNTADRSLAMIDYALRRRFAFFELEPAFDSEGFKAILNEKSYPKFTALVEQIKALNEVISKDESLGDGFRIGHSYLCTKEEITDEWLLSVINYELIPLLNEYWFEDQSKIEQWTKKLCGALND